MRDQTIPQYFAGRNIFVTGATGFMGKALLEKLLRSCPEIGTIYILMRKKKGQGLEERLEQLINQKVYDRLREERPGILEKKIRPLGGDVTELGLGLSKVDRETIINEVSIIYHVAASVRFDDPLKDAVVLNMRGTREVCQLALDTKKISVLIHVSTAFVNCDRSEANEEIYTAKADWKKTIELAEKCDDRVLSIMTSKYLNGMPNTYTFTKSLGEHIVFDMCSGKIPVKIIRPSIVVSSMEEPVQGWIDNFNGPIGLMTACGKGIMRTHYVNIQNKPDYIPVDIAIKATVVATWDLGLRQEKKKPEIIHCTSHEIEWGRPTMEKLALTALDLIEEVPLNDMMWVPSSHYTTSLTVWYIRVLLCQLLPAFLLDCCLKMAGKKPMLMRLQKKMFVAQLALRYFMNNEWIYTNKHLLELQNEVLAVDLKDWDYDFSYYDFKNYVRQSILGTRKYLLKESEESLPQAKRHYKRMKWVDRITKSVFYIFIFFLIWKLDMFNMALAKIDRVTEYFVNAIEM